MTDLCTVCGRRVSDHRSEDGSWIGCVPLSPMFVTLANGSVYLLRTPRDVYRVAVLARKAA
jgi:hypothetical protein